MARTFAHLRCHSATELDDQPIATQQPNRTHHVLRVYRTGRLKTAHDLFVQDVLFSSLRQIPRTLAHYLRPRLFCSYI